MDMIGDVFFDFDRPSLAHVLLITPLHLVNLEEHRHNFQLDITPPPAHRV